MTSNNTWKKPHIVYNTFSVSLHVNIANSIFQSISTFRDEIVLFHVDYHVHDGSSQRDLFSFSWLLILPLHDFAGVIVWVHPNQESIYSCAKWTLWKGSEFFWNTPIYTSPRVWSSCLAHQFRQWHWYWGLARESGIP